MMRYLAWVTCRVMPRLDADGLLSGTSLSSCVTSVDQLLVGSSNVAARFEACIINVAISFDCVKPGFETVGINVVIDVS